jgi:hypothetical protein
MMSSVTICNHCAGKIVLSLGTHHEDQGLTFCSIECAESYARQSSNDPEHHPIGLARDLGVEVTDF